MHRFPCYQAHCRNPHAAPKGEHGNYPSTGKKHKRGKVTTPYHG